MLSEILCVPQENALNESFLIFKKIQPTTPLKDFGINENEFDGFADGILKGQVRLLNNNYIQLTKPDIVNIYKSIY